MDPTVLSQIPNEYKQIYQSNWKTIKKSVKQGRLKDVYHFPLIEQSNSEIASKLQQVITNYSDKIKINVAFGFILKNRTTEEWKFFHPSNNTMLFQTPRLLASPNDYRKLIEEVEQEDAFEYARLQRPSTNWIVDRVICVRFDVTKLGSNILHA